MKNIYKLGLLVLPFGALLLVPNAKADEARIETRYMEKVNDIVEEHTEAMKKIDASTLSTEQKAVLITQSEANRDLALTHLEDARDQLKNNLLERATLTNPIDETIRDNMKLIDEIDEILID